MSRIRARVTIATASAAVAATVVYTALAARVSFPVPQVSVQVHPVLVAELFEPHRLYDSADASDTVALHPQIPKVDEAITSDAINYFSGVKVLEDSVATSDYLTRIHTKPLDFDNTDTDVDPDPVNTSDFAAFTFIKPDVTDTATVSDAALLHVQPVYADSVGATDAIDAVHMVKVLEDSVVVTDEATTIYIPTRILTESAGATDELTVNIMSGVDSRTFAGYALNATNFN